MLQKYDFLALIKIKARYVIDYIILRYSYTNSN
jgi:hypothetical protein